MMQLALDLDLLPLNTEEWNLTPELAEGLHEELYIKSISLLRDSVPGGEQWQEIMSWLDEPIVNDNRPFSFATCCKVIGIEDPEANRDSIKKYLAM